MQPVVRDDAKQFDPQTHAYAEFRLFSRLAAERTSVSSAVVTLHRADTHTVCWITVVTADGETLHATASERHPYAAIDRAVADVATAIRLHDVRSRPERETA